MSQGKVLVEFKKANGGNIEVSEEKFMQSQQWFEKINKEVQSQIGVPDASHEIDKLNDRSMFEQDDKDVEMAEEQPERGSSLSPIYEAENNYPKEPSKTPIMIINNTAKFKPFTPPTISDEVRQQMIAQRNSDRKRKANDDDEAVSIFPTTPITLAPSEPPLVITPEMRERARRNREAALAKRRSLQNFNN